MTDLEKVKKGLYQHCEGSMFDRCGECPYYEVADEPFQCRDALLMDALTLLKEQETEDTGRCRVFQCRKCGFGMDDIFVIDEEKYQVIPRYCPNCGRSVTFE